MIEVISAIIAIAAIELYATYKGMNGKMMALTIAILSGLGGYTIGLGGI
jgi:hypothetical protein